LNAYEVSTRTPPLAIEWRLWRGMYLLDRRGRKCELGGCAVVGPAGGLLETQFGVYAVEPVAVML
jgi:hypothetical protein